MFVEDMAQVAREMLVTISDDAMLIDVARLLSSGTDLVVVCSAADTLQGVVTKTDVVKQIGACQGAASTRPVSTALTRDVVRCPPADGLQDVAELMKQRRLKNVPVVDGEGRPIGLLSARAVLRVLLGDAEYEQAQLTDYVKGVGYR